MANRRQTERIMETAQIKNMELARMRAQIHSLPAGSLSGGQRVYDPDDRRTFYLSPDPEERAWAKDLYGIDGSDPFDGLTHGEKKILGDAAEHEVAQITPEVVSRAKRQGRQDDDLKSLIWEKYQASHPSTAHAEYTALGAAGERLLQRYGADVVRAMAKHDPQALVDEIESEVWLPSEDSGTQAPSATPSYQGSETSSLSYGGGSRSGRRPFDREPDEKPEDPDDMFAALNAQKKREGWI